jgi:predicted RNA-binding protein with PIN domain
MKYLIDGYNLLFYFSESSSTLENQRNKIIKLLNQFFSTTHYQAVIVFDGKTPHDLLEDNYYYDSLKVIYTTQGKSADSYILDQPLSSLSTVVTSDKTLARLCRHKGANTKNIRSFLKWVIKSYKKFSSTINIKTDYEDTEDNIARLEEIFEKRLEQLDKES